MKKAWSERKQKKIARASVFKGEFQYEAALFFPGEEVMCVAKALEEGKINKKTYIIAVERDKKIADKIRSKLLSLGFYSDNIYVHSDKLVNLQLKEVLKGKKLTFAFFDFCGSLSLLLLEWLYHNMDKDTVETCAEIAFTYNTCGRSDKFINSFLSDEYLWIFKKTSELTGVTDASDLSSHEKRRLLQIIFTSGSMTDLQVQLEDKIEYRDTVSMMTFRLKVVYTELLGNEYSAALRIAKFDRDVSLLRAPLFAQLENGFEPNFGPGEKASVVRKMIKDLNTEKPTWMTLDEWGRCPLNYNSCGLFVPKSTFDDYLKDTSLWLVHFTRSGEHATELFRGEKKDIERFLHTVSKGSANVYSFEPIRFTHIPKNFDPQYLLPM